MGAATIQAIKELSIGVVGIIAMALICYFQMKGFEKISRSSDRLSQSHDNLTKNVDLNNKISQKLLDAVEKNKCNASDLIRNGCAKKMTTRRS